MFNTASECELTELQPDRKAPNKRLGIHCVDIGSGESVNDSNSRVIWLARWCRDALKVLSSTTWAIVSFGALIA